jgi:hypothetical protein
MIAVLNENGFCGRNILLNKTTRRPHCKKMKRSSKYFVIFIAFVVSLRVLFWLFCPVVFARHEMDFTLYRYYKKIIDLWEGRFSS